MRQRQKLKQGIYKPREAEDGRPVSEARRGEEGFLPETWKGHVLAETVRLPLDSPASTTAREYISIVLSHLV